MEYSFLRFHSFCTSVFKVIYIYIYIYIYISSGGTDGKLGGRADMHGQELMSMGALAALLMAFISAVYKACI